MIYFNVFDSISEINITFLQSIICGLKYIISIFESMSEMRHGMLIKVDI